MFSIPIRYLLLFLTNCRLPQAQIQHRRRTCQAATGNVTWCEYIRLFSEWESLDSKRKTWFFTVRPGSSQTALCVGFVARPRDGAASFTSISHHHLHPLRRLANRCACAIVPSGAAMQAQSKINDQVTFSCHWTARRARSNSRGLATRPAHHSIREDPGWTVKFQSVLIRRFLHRLTILLW